MAESIFKKHQLDITVDVELNDAQRKATNVKIKNMANEWQDLLDDAIKQGIEQGAKSASLKDVLTQFNAQLKAFKLEPLTITVDELQVMDKPIEHAAKLVIQKLGDSFKGGGLGNIISEEITDSLDVLSSTVDKIYKKMEQGAKKSAQNISKSMAEIAEAADTYKTKASMKQIDKAISSKPTQNKAEANVKGLLDESVSAKKNGASWDKQYLADVNFVKNYKKVGVDKLKEIFGDQFSQVENYYNQLAKVHQQKIIALNDILAQKEFVGGSAKNPTQYQFKGETWAREKTLQEVKSILSGGLTVKGDNGGSSGDGAKPNKPNTKVPPVSRGDLVEIYRGIIPPDDDSLTRKEVLNNGDGSEWWATNKNAARTYADMDKGGAILVGTISPKNPLIIDAGGHNYDDFANMPGIQDVAEQFPELKKLIDSKADITDIQKYINTRAGELGHDVVRFDNVNDVLNPMAFKEIGSTFAILDDSILEVTGAFAQLEYDLEESLGDYSKKPSVENIPDYYKPPVSHQPSVIAEGPEIINDSLTEEATLLEKIQKLTSYIDDNYLSSGKHLSDFLDDIQKESNELDGELKEILTTLNLIDDKGNLKFDIKHNGEEGGGTTHNGALISDDFVLIERGDYESVKNSRLPDSTQNAAKDGVNVAEVLGYLPSKHTGGFFDVQGTAKGHNLFENGVISQDVVEATEDQLEQLVQAFIKARDYGFDIENGGSNIVYDKEKGFSFYDLEELSVDDAEFWNSKTEAEKKLDALENLFSLFSGLNRDHTNFANDVNVGAFAERIKGVVESKGIVDHNAVDVSGRNYEDIYDDVFSGNIDDESDDIIALLQAEAEAHKKNADAIKEEVAAEKELNDAKAQDVNTTPEVEHTPDTKGSSSVGTDIKASIDPEELRSLLNSITYNVKVVQDAEPVENNKVSIDEASLENVLNRITYNVKLAHDDNDKESNKIAIDEKTLESTLNRVFANVLNPEVEQGEAEPKEAPWALESTLNTTIKGVLDQIQTNTSKIGIVDTVPSDTAGVSEATTKLVEIKSILESINAKIMKGGVVATRGAVKQAGVQSAEPDVKIQASHSNMMKSLINDYKTMGKLAAQFASDGNLETKAMLENIKEEIRRKRASLNITMDENANLRERYSIAFDAEKKLIEAEKQQKKINDNRKADVKAEKKRLADAKKLAQREAMLGKAGSAVGRAESTWVSAAGIDGELPAGFVADIDEYYQKLDSLRKKHQELKNSDMISEEQKQELIAQTREVNKMTAEIGELVAEYQRLSGDNATVIGSNALGADAGLGAYEQQLKQTVMTATNGKAQIKSFDAATRTLTYTVKTGKNEFTEYTAAVRRADGALVSVQGATKRTETFIEATMRKMKEISSYMSGMSLISRAGQELRRGIQYVREIDLALTELKKVTDETEETYDKFLDTAAKTADKVGSTIQKVVSSTADWARLGYSMEQAAKFAETTQILMNVSEFTDVSQATDTLISAVQAFGYTADTSMEVVDLLNTIGK